MLVLCALMAPVCTARAVQTSAVSAILVDGESGRVLYEHNAQEQRSIASITKLMTALVAVESTPDLEQTVTIRQEWTGAEGSSLYLRAGEEMSLKDLLYGLLLQSGNDAAIAVAGFCAGDVDTFVAWMNLRAQSLGMEDTHFANPNGLDQEGHYSTAADMAILARVCMAQETIAQIVGTRSLTLGSRTLTNHNKLLWRYEGCVGLKTGYTEQAGRTLVSAARQGEQLLIAVTLGDPNDWEDHTALFDYGFSQWPAFTLCTEDHTFRRIPVQGSLTRFVEVRTAADLRYPLASSESIRAEVSLPDCVDAPVEEGQIAGMLRFYLEDQVIGETYLVYAQSVNRDVVASGGLLGRILDLFRSEGAESLLETFTGRQFPSSLTALQHSGSGG